MSSQFTSPWLPLASFLSLQLAQVSGWFKIQWCILGMFSGSQVMVTCMLISINSWSTVIAIDKDMLMFMDVCLAKVVAVRFDVVQGFSG